MHINPATGQVTNDGSLLYQGEGRGYGADLLSPAAGRGRLDPGFWQPYYDSKNRLCLNLRTGEYDEKDGVLTPKKKVWLARELRARGVDNPVWNAAAMPKDAWIFMQQRVVPATRKRLRLYADMAQQVPIGGFNAWAALTYEYQATTDPGFAVKDMDGLSPGQGDRPAFSLLSHPLAIIHSDWSFSDRDLAVFAQKGVPLPTRMIDSASRRCGELVEQTAIGVATGMTFGPTNSEDSRYTSPPSSVEYGVTTFPSRIIYNTLHVPDTAHPEYIQNDVQAMIETAVEDNFFGPYILYHSTGYETFLNGDYFRTGGTTVSTSVRQRLLQDTRITDVRRLDYLTSGYQLVLVQMDSEYMGAINGMDFQVMAWSERGNMMHKYVVMGIQTALFMSPYNGISPIVHGTTS